VRNPENRAAESVPFAANIFFIQIGTKIGGGGSAGAHLYRETRQCHGDTGHIRVDFEGKDGG
jgi:predicted NBD/HSP70 family sugar kinase